MTFELWAQLQVELEDVFKKYPLSIQLASGSMFWPNYDENGKQIPGLYTIVIVEKP